jgi:hypothetical protein
MFGPGADRAFQQVSRPGLFEDCQGFLKIEGNPVMRRGLKIEGNPVMRRGATGHRNQCETIELVTQGSCRSSHARSSTSVIGFEGQLMPRCVARSRRPLQRLRPRSPAPDVQRALAPNSRERDTPGPQPARQGPNGQRSPVILSHSRTNWVCVLRNASQSVGTSTLNSVIGMPPAGGGTSTRGE